MSSKSKAFSESALSPIIGPSSNGGVVIDSSFLVQSSAVDALDGFSGGAAAQNPAARVPGTGNRRLRQRAIRELLSEPVPVVADLSFQVGALHAIADPGAPRRLQALPQAAGPRPIPPESASALILAEGLFKFGQTREKMPGA